MSDGAAELERDDADAASEDMEVADEATGADDCRGPTVTDWLLIEAIDEETPDANAEDCELDIFGT